MRDTSKTSTILKNSGSSPGQLTTLCKQALKGVLDNRFPIVAGQPRRYTRHDTEAIVLAIDLHSAGQSPKHIKSVLSKENISVISRDMRCGAGYLVIYRDLSISTFHSLANSIASKNAELLPTLTLDLAAIRKRVEQSIIDAETSASGAV